MTFSGNFDTFENDQQRLDELKAVEAEMRQPDYQQPTYTEEQLVLPLRS